MSDLPDPPPAPSAAELLRHREWLQRLARALTRDGHAAADVEQQTWLAALASPPVDASSPRAWLGTVARNFVRRDARSQSRRLRRERQAIRIADGRPADDLAAESEVAASVTRAVLALQEPLRSAVLLRFYEGLTVPQVAARMQTPFETTRSRLRTAIRHLRASIPPEADPLLALAAPLALVSHHSTSVAPIQGALVMAKVTKLTAASIAILAVGVGGAWVASEVLSVETPGEIDVATAEAVPAVAEPEVERLQRRIDELEELLARRDRPRVRVERVERVAPTRARETAQAQTTATLALGAWSEQVAVGAQSIDLSFTVDPQRGNPIDLSLVTEVPEPVEPIDLSTLSDSELLEHARGLAKGGNTRDALRATREAWQTLVDRDPIVETLDEALFGLGIAHRNLGDHSVERVTFDRLIELAGYHTERGQSARYQRAWALHYGGDSAAAANEMESIAEAAGDGSDRARHSLLNGSAFAQGAENPEQARRMLRRLGVAVERDSSSLARFFDGQSRERLGRMK